MSTSSTSSMVSAFPDDYTPTPAPDRRAGREGNLGQRARGSQGRGSSRNVLVLALRAGSAGNGFGRILCFEPEYRGEPPEVVGDIFRSSMRFLEGAEAVRTVASPPVATGDVGEPIANMLPPLLDAAIEWMAQLGVALDRLLVAVHDGTSVDEAQQLFAQARSRQSSGVSRSSDPAYDVFFELRTWHCVTTSIVGMAVPSESRVPAPSSYSGSNGRLVPGTHDAVPARRAGTSGSEVLVSLDTTQRHWDRWVRAPRQHRLMTQRGG